MAQVFWRIELGATLFPPLLIPDEISVHQLQTILQTAGIRIPVVCKNINCATTCGFIANVSMVGNKLSIGNQSMHRTDPALPVPVLFDSMGNCPSLDSSEYDSMNFFRNSSSLVCFKSVIPAATLIFFGSCVEPGLLYYASHPEIPIEGMVVITITCIVMSAAASFALVVICDSTLQETTEVHNVILQSALGLTLGSDVALARFGNELPIIDEALPEARWSSLMMIGEAVTLGATSISCFQSLELGVLTLLCLVGFYFIARSGIDVSWKYQ